LHNKPQGCGASVASAAGPFSTKNPNQWVIMPAPITAIFWKLLMAMVTLVLVGIMVIAGLTTHKIKIMRSTNHITPTCFRTLPNIVLSLGAVFSHAVNSNRVTSFILTYCRNFSNSSHISESSNTKQFAQCYEEQTPQNTNKETRWWRDLWFPWR
jgi:hypothetical protein